MRGGSVCVKCSPFDGRRRVTRIEQVQTKGREAKFDHFGITK